MALQAGPTTLQQEQQQQVLLSQCASGSHHQPAIWQQPQQQQPHCVCLTCLGSMLVLAPCDSFDRLSLHNVRRLCNSVGACCRDPTVTV